MGPIAWLTILHTYFIGLFNNFSAEPKIKGQIYKDRGGGGRAEERLEKKKGYKAMNRGLCMCGMTPGKGKQGDGVRQHVCPLCLKITFISVAFGLHYTSVSF